MKALSDNEFRALDAYHEKNPSTIYEEERARLREEALDQEEDDDDGPSDEGGAPEDQKAYKDSQVHEVAVYCFYLAIAASPNCQSNIYCYICIEYSK